MTLFADGFESGTMSAWTSVSGSANAVQGSAFAGSWYGRATSTGSSTYAQATLASPQSEIYVQSAVNVIAPPGGAVVSLKVDKNLALRVKNHVSGSQTTSATPLPVGAWRLVQLHARRDPRGMHAGRGRDLRLARRRAQLQLHAHRGMRGRIADGHMPVPGGTYSDSGSQACT